MYPAIKTLYWIACLLFLLVFYKWSMPNTWVNILSAFSNLLLYILISETSIHYFIIPKYFHRGKYTQALFWVLSIFAINGTLSLFLSWSIIQPYSRSSFADLFWSWDNLIYGIYFICFAFIGFSITTKLVFDGLRIQKRMAELEKEKATAELAFLKAQANPHFLFNSINSIFGHIDKGNKTARNLLLQFSDLLRYQLYECNAEQILIEKEVTYLDNYVELQKSRRSKNHITHFDREGCLSGYTVAPLLFIPFVENAFKYVSASPNGPDFVNIELREAGRRLHFHCRNSRTLRIGKDVLPSGGIGIQNVRRRLQLLYPDRHELSILETETEYEIRLILTL